MDILLAQLIGLTYLILGIGMLFNSKYYGETIASFAKEKGMILMGSILSLIIGLALVLTHNTWTNDWTTIITVFGWLALIKGIILSLLPDHMSSMYQKVAKNKNFVIIGGLTALIIGIVLCGFGFGYFG